MKSSARSRSLLFGALFALLAPAVAQAHPGHSTSGLAAGLLHPVSGWDHLLAMLAVGLWAAQLGGRAVWKAPLAFVGALLGGGVLAFAHVRLPFVEPAILASVLVLSLLVTFAVRMPVPASAAVVAFFALFHGFAHAAEMPATADGLSYAVGFIVSTALLLGAGVGLGLVLSRAARPAWVQAVGGAMAFSSVFIALA